MGQLPPLDDTIPAAVRAAILDRLVVVVEMAAGPSFVAVRTERFVPARVLGEGLAVLERYRTTMRRGRVVLDNGRTLVFERNGFLAFT